MHPADSCGCPDSRGSMSALRHRRGPDEGSTLGAWQQFTLSALALIVVFSLAMSWMGPMLDHHFAERHPGHQHIYLGTVSPDHSHDYEAFHSHSTFLLLQLTAEWPTAGPADGIVFVAPDGGLAKGVADVTVPVHSQSLRADFGDSTGALGRHLHVESILPGATIVPPTLPPRA